MAKTLSSQMRRMQTKQSTLKENAVKNTTVTKKTGREAPVTVKQGVPLDHAVKHKSYENAKFGMSKGATINMDNYESMRIDVWLTDEVREGESIREAYTRIEAILDEVLEDTVMSARNE